MICAYIDQYRHQFGVEPICRVLTEHHMPIAPSSYYAHCSQPVSDALREEAVLVNAVIDLHREHRDLYGSRKMWHLMTQAGHQVGRDQVARHPMSNSVKPRRLGGVARQCLRRIWCRC